MNRFSVCLFSLVFTQVVVAQDKSFTERLGPITAGPVAQSETLDLPVLTWGGDVVDMWANGGVMTTPTSLFGKQGLKFRIVNGDDFPAQVRRYMEGKTPFLRGTFGQIAEAAEVVNKNQTTKPVVVVLKTWSKGDHVVSRSKLKTLNDLKGTTGVLQRGGPHVELVSQMLKAAGLTWKDIRVKWVDDLTGDKGPAEVFRKDNSVDWCCVISPDMLGLVPPEGGVAGADGTIAGAHVILSTNEASRVIADVLCVRADFFEKNRELIAKYVGGFLRGTEELLTAKKAYDDGKGKSPSYLSILKVAQGFYGEKVLPTLETDAHGLVSDADFARLPGNIEFFTGEGIAYGFNSKQSQVLDLMVDLGEISKEGRSGFLTARWDWTTMAKLADIPYTTPKRENRVDAESVELFPDSNLDDKTIVSFVIKFEPNQQDFSIDTYASDFRRVIDQSQVFGNAVVVIRGHADPTKTLVDLIKAGLNKGILKQQGNSKEGMRYFLKDGSLLDVANTDRVAEMIRKGDFAGTTPNPQDTMQAALNLSQLRANQVRKAIVEYSKKEGLQLDITQIQPVGVGIREPVVPKPTNMDQARENMRVEFRLIRIPAEAIKGDDFDILGK